MTDKGIFFQGIVLWLVIFLSLPNPGQAAGGLSAQNSLLMEMSTGRVLYENGGYERQSIASLTKVMTAIIALEYGQLSDQVKTSRRAIHTPGSSIYLEQGEKMTLEDLIYGLMLRSGNDAAVAIAEHIAGSVEAFAFLMNEKAAWIGLTDTQFKNPHGLEEEGHYSSAYDLALLMQYAMGNENFRGISRTKTYLAKNRSYPWVNKNKLLNQLYPYCTGGKTGFTKKAGRTLVTTAKKDHMELIAVTLNASADWQDHMALYEWGYQHYEMSLVDPSFTLPQIEVREKKSRDLESFKLYPLSIPERQLLARANHGLNWSSLNEDYWDLTKKVFQKMMWLRWIDDD